MNLSPSLKEKYTTEQLSARDAQRLAEFIAWGPVVFQASRLMIKFGILILIRDSKNGLTQKDICEKTKLSDYAVKCLLEASLCIGTILVDTDTDKFTISKTGWFLLNDPATRANINFNHDVNYEGWFKLEDSLLKGKPKGLLHFGNWPTVYEALSELPKQVQKSWFDFDHFYSDHSFDEALAIVFGKYHPNTLFDIGGNTGRWALRCVDYNADVQITIFDLPQQIEIMKKHIRNKKGAERIEGYGIDLLDKKQQFPANKQVDAIWMSQFLDCFCASEIIEILRRTQKIMRSDTRLFIMETLWDRQRFEPAAFCLTMTSLYFTAIANGNSKMYNKEDMESCINEAGLEIETIYDHLGHGHSILVCKIKE